MLDLRKRFLEEAFAPNGTPVRNIDVVVTAVRLPNGAIETITNYQGVETKLKYLRDAYDDMFCLKANPDVEIVGYMIY
ncbi:hypothetical protein KO561_05270 [Radiobacillus kanasensis]|uniref:hypothetical protein n=1 Tax=Radiobacillus kanasensis TaxID=2844358 RepID=UPI001E37E82A|nr:hypothetical protein [Radiobacillus kanasensis]UFU00360.1 hypothetical protein KO561_05270 [Radiobacillus kanasensis]